MSNELTTLFTGRKQILLDEVDSTNKKMTSILQHGSLPEGTVVRTGYQSSGKGQGNNQWHSEAGKNLLVSFLFYPDFIPAAEIFDWNRAVALAITDAIKLFAVDPNSVYIKWPNDVYIGDEKLGGLLLENTISGSTLRQSIVGIGINVNQTEFPETLPNPVSLIKHLGQTISINNLFHEISNALERRYLQCKRKDMTSLRAHYLERLYRMQVRASFEAAGSAFHGTISGVSREGRLEIQHDDGTVKSYDLKEVRFLH